MSFNLHLPSIRKPVAGLIQAVSVFALFCAIAAPAQAQTTNPRIPTLTCGTHPAVLNTAIDGKNGFNNSSDPLTSGTDGHWDWASSTIQYPSNVGLNYPKSNVVPGNTATDQPAVATDSIGIGGKLIKNPQTDIIDSAWTVAPCIQRRCLAAFAFQQCELAWWIGFATWHYLFPLPIQIGYAGRCSQVPLEF